MRGVAHHRPRPIVASTTGLPNLPPSGTSGSYEQASSDNGESPTRCVSKGPFLIQISEVVRFLQAKMLCENPFESIFAIEWSEL